MKKKKIVEFLGRQLSRLRLGQGYYTLIMSTVSAISLVSIAFEITIELLIILFPIIFFGTFMIGYALDKLNISSVDYRKTTEISGRLANYLDYKNYDMRMITTEGFMKQAEALSRGEEFDIDAFLLGKKEEFMKKWGREE